MWPFDEGAILVCQPHFLFKVVNFYCFSLEIVHVYVS